MRYRRAHGTERRAMVRARDLGWPPAYESLIFAAGFMVGAACAFLVGFGWGLGLIVGEVGQ